MSRVRWAVGAVAAFAVVTGTGLWGPQPVASYNGDQLGPDRDENLGEYQARTAPALAEASDPAYALVSFRAPLTPEQAAEVLASAPRVNAMVLGAAAPVAIPEPVAGATRADVFATELQRIGDSFEGIGNVPGPRVIDAVVVHASGDELRSIAAHQEVEVVDALPSDAPWGSFAVRPVSTIDRP